MTLVQEGKAEKLVSRLPNAGQIPLRVALVNIHGDNFGDAANCASAWDWAQDRIRCELHAGLPAPGEWEVLPDLVTMPSVALPLRDMTAALEDVRLHLSGIAHDCANAALWTQLTAALSGCHVVLMPPCGPAVGPYQQASYLVPFVIARTLGIPTVLLFGTIQPSGSDQFDAVAREVVGESLIAVRNQESWDYLRSFGYDAPTPMDLTHHWISERQMTDNSLQRPVVSVVLGDELTWHPAAADLEGTSGRQPAYQLIAEACARATPEHLTVELIPHSRKQSEMDRLNRLASGWEGRQCLVRSDVRNLDDYLSAISSSTLVVSLRYHGAVAATAAGVPVIAVAYEDKTTTFMRLTSQSDKCISVQDVTDTYLRGAIKAAIAGSRHGTRQLPFGSGAAFEFRRKALEELWLRAMGRVLTSLSASRTL